MSKLLHLDTSIRVANSVSRQLSAAIVAHLKTTSEAIDIIYRDLAVNPLPHLTDVVFTSFGSTDVSALSPKQQTEVHESNRVLDEFMAADIVVIGVAFYNFSIPSSLKAWIDRVIVSGETFSVDTNGMIGLAGGKRVIVAIARSGVYSNGSPYEQCEHAENYLRDIFSVIGINDLEVVIAEGLAFGPEASAAALQKAKSDIDTISGLGS